MGFCKSDQKSIPVVGFLTHNDCDVLRAKTGLYRRLTHRTIILPTLHSTSPLPPFAALLSPLHPLFLLHSTSAVALSTLKFTFLVPFTPRQAFPVAATRALSATCIRFWVASFILICWILTSSHATPYLSGTTLHSIPQHTLDFDTPCAHTTPPLLATSRAE